MARKKRRYILMLVIYALILIYMLFLKNINSTYPYTYTEYIKSMINIIPFKSVYILITTPVLTISVVLRFVVNLIGNIVLFVPWGLFAIIFNAFRTLKNYFLFTLGVILIIEAVQLFTMLGIFDLEDIMLNLSGAFFGYWYVMKFCDEK